MNSNKTQPVLILGAITTFLTVVCGGITLVAGLQDNKTVALYAGIAMLLTAGINQAKDFYVKGQVVPVVDAGAYLDGDRNMIAGPAAKQVSGTAVSVVSGQGAVDHGGAI